ncbi:unnamed protein product [Echinostoma caproni]|uniref:Uncharacterized protein n=1 Tax=Echinostoma caproni TaxID=27848 RepID=A0A183AJ54_9TREM|nr:unnamed protein product [Echinostoma caproni]
MRPTIQGTQVLPLSRTLAGEHHGGQLQGLTLETGSVAPKIGATMSFLRQVWVVWNQGLANSSRLTTSS